MVRYGSVDYPTCQVQRPIKKIIGTVKSAENLYFVRAIILIKICYVSFDASYVRPWNRIKKWADGIIGGSVCIVLYANLNGS